MNPIPNRRRHRTLKALKALKAAVVLVPAAVLAQTPDVFTYNSGFSLGGAIPDGNVTGWTDSRTVSGLSYTSISSIKVSLEISGGWAGDFYAYLSNGTDISILLNRVGVTALDPFGYSDSALDLTFADSAANGDIHLYQNLSGYASLINFGAEFSPDARGIDPATVVDTDPRTQYLSTFVGTNPNATWTLFIADVSSGNTGTLTSWGLEFTGSTPAPVPETASPTWLVGLLAAGSLWRRRRLRA